MLKTVSKDTNYYFQNLIWNWKLEQIESINIFWWISKNLYLFLNKYIYKQKLLIGYRHEKVTMKIPDALSLTL